MITSWPGTRGDIPGKHFAGISCILIILATGCAIPAFAGQPPHHFTETVVSVLTPDSDQDLPFIFENGVVFIDFRNGTAGVRTYDPATGNEEMISGTFSPTQFSPPSASGDRIAWESFDGNEAFICLYNASSGDRVILANLTYQLGSYPVIRGDLVAYSDYSGTDLDIHIIDLHLGETLVLDNGTESTDDSAPDICGDTVVWQGVNRAGGDSDIYLWKRGTPDIRDLTTGTPDILQAYPDIDGNYVVWQGYDRLNNTYDIYLHDLAGNETTLLTPGTSYTDERNPKISGDCIVWQCLNISTSVNEIVFYSISSEELVPVSIRGHGEQYDPSIYGDRIAWSEMDAMSGKFDICMATHGIQAPPLVPSFDANKTAGSVPLAVQFQDRSSGDPTGWWWDFGDGDYSREQNPGHVYTRPGMYPVTLIVNTPYRREGFCVENMVVVGSPPFVEFQGEPVYGIAPLEVQFSDLSSGNPSEWLWDFGDGDTSAEKNPMHAYISPGLYNVTLASGNDFWGDTTEKTGYIAVMQGYKQDITFSIEGITLDEEGGRQVIVLNDTVLGGNWSKTKPLTFSHPFPVTTSHPSVSTLPTDLRSPGSWVGFWRARSGQSILRPLKSGMDLLPWDGPSLHASLSPAIPRMGGLS